MDASTEQRILSKVEYVREAVVILADVRDSSSFDEYQTDRRQRDVVEREFQTAIEACIDIGSMILRVEDAEVLDTNAAVFRRLVDYGILEQQLGQRMAEAAGFRNVLAHKYGMGIDDEDVYNVLKHELPLFEEYLTEIRAYLGSKRE